MMKLPEPMVRSFVELHPDDAAHAFETLELAEAVRLLKRLPVDVAASLLERATPHTAARILEPLDVQRIRQLTSEMSPRTAAAVLHQLDEANREEVLSGLADSAARSLRALASQGGNTGSQSLAVVMRGLALREVLPGVKKRVILKELLGGFINGAAVALVTTVAVFAWRRAAGDDLSSCLGLSLVIGLAMIVNMAIAAMSGAVIPLVLKALGRDPAQSAAIFLTTVTDIVGFASFLGLAVLFSSWLLPNV